MPRLEGKEVLMEWDVSHWGRTNIVSWRPASRNYFWSYPAIPLRRTFSFRYRMVKPLLLQQTAIFQLKHHDLCRIENGIPSKAKTKAYLSRTKLIPCPSCIFRFCDSVYNPAYSRHAPPSKWYLRCVPYTISPFKNFPYPTSHLDLKPHPASRQTYVGP